jgi:hypothetical protein
LSVNEDSALEKLNLATQKLPLSKLRAAIAKEEKPLENMMRKTLKKRVCKKHRKFTGFT